MADRKDVSPRRRPPILGRIVGTLIAVGLFFLIVYGGEGALPGIGNPSGGVGEPFTLVGAESRIVSSSDFTNSFLLIQFGKPRALQDGRPVAAGWLDLMGQTLTLLSEEERARVVPVFIGIDADHDTVEDVAAYAQAVHPDIIGLTGTPEEIQKVAEDYRVKISTAPTEDGSPGAITGYDASIYLMGPDARYLASFPPHESPSHIAEAIRKVLPTVPVRSSPDAPAALPVSAGE